MVNPIGEYTVEWMGAAADFEIDLNNRVKQGWKLVNSGWADGDLI